MRLRARILSGFAILHLVVLGLLLAYVTVEIRAGTEREGIARRSLQSGLVDVLEERLAAEGPDVATLLGWPHWGAFSDALLMERSSLGDDPEPLETTLLLSPVGRSMRGPGFDLDHVRSMIAKAVEEDRIVQTPAAFAVPVKAGGNAWGGGWFAYRGGGGVGVSVQQVAGITAAAVLLTMLAVGMGLNRWVLAPVEALSGGARRMARGDRRVRVRGIHGGHEMAQLVDTFNEMSGEVETYHQDLEAQVAEATRQAVQGARLAATGTLAAGVAHEINNPLSGLMNAARALREADLDPERAATYHRLLETGLERIGVTVGALLRLAPRDVGDPETVVLAPVLEDVATLVAHRAGGVGVLVDVSGVAADASCLGDPMAVRQVLLNLLLNAVDAAHTQVAVDAIEHGGRLVVRVGDDGPGMDEEAAGRAFELFFTTKDPGQGTGIGLALVHRLVTDMGGDVTLGTSSLGGLEVTLRLVMAESSAA